MEGRRGQTCSSDDRQKPCSRGTDSDDSLQLFGMMHYPTVYVMEAWTRVYQSVWTLPRRQLRQYENDPVIEDNEDDDNDVLKADPENLGISARFFFIYCKNLPS